MPISDWFKAREDRRYTVTSGSPTDVLPDGVWIKCPSCKHTLYQGDLSRSLMVCPHCEHHLPMDASERIASLADDGTFAETDATLASVDPLRFTAAKPYPASLEHARESTGLTEAVVTGRALVGGHPAVLGAMDFRFIGASMGSAVGEKIARAFAIGTAEERAVVLAIASGGARMQEGMYSLMQMAKTAAAARARGRGAALRRHPDEPHLRRCDRVVRHARRRDPCRARGDGGLRRSVARRADHAAGHAEGLPDR
jgi:acetyl-CoA carboxylase carboxyl transferase subunit beta